MSNGKVIVDGISYLASAYCGGDNSGVNVVLSEEGGNVIHVYLVDELAKAFTDADVVFMEALGFFHTSHDEDEHAEFAYSHFWLFL